ncbi:hypothetical protein EMPS_07149 [Entomortierella parvispora]|uniref:Uncharacterized protein n=1 Tax=Entomortierella parvispora TaxID=205924 RepID=A0A9P3HDV6_9FUNG|nr:hypothetical protein EMPS_07149 [Entomortierella parvispora]
MDGVDCDWCLVCDKHTAENEAYCSEECRSTDLMSSSASSSSSSNSAHSAYFHSLHSHYPALSSSSSTFSSSSGMSSDGSASSSFSSLNDNYPMPPFQRKQRISCPNIYAQCAANPNPPPSLMFTTGGNAASALSQHLLMQHQKLMQESCHGHNPASTIPPLPGHAYPSQSGNAYHANNGRPGSPFGQQ